MTKNQRKVVWIGLLALAPLAGMSSYAFIPRHSDVAGDALVVAVAVVFVIAALFVRAGGDPQG